MNTIVSKSASLNSPLWFLDGGGAGDVNFGDLVGIVQNFNKGNDVGTAGPILVGSSQTAGMSVPRLGPAMDPRQYYYSASDQLIEEDAPVVSEDDSGASPSVSYTMMVADQYSWGLAYQNELIERDQTTINTIGTLGGVLSFSSQRLYALQDANWNVVALVNTSGTVVERFDYTPYGTQKVLTASGGVNYNGDPYGWNVGFQGMYADLVNMATVWSESRPEDVPLGIWMMQEPSGPQYVDGMNLYWAFDDNPVSERNKSDAIGYVKNQSGRAGKWSSSKFFLHQLNHHPPPDDGRRPLQARKSDVIFRVEEPVNLTTARL